MRPNALFRALSSFEKGVASRKVRWIYGLACGRRRTDWYAALVFLVPCSLCFTVSMWPLVLPSDLIEGVYRQTATSARTCAVAMETTVAPVVAEQYEYNRAKCLERGGCPSPEDMGTLIRQQTEACGSDPVEAARNLDMLIDIAAQDQQLDISEGVSAGGGGGGRRLLQLEDVLDLVTQNAGDAVPSDAADMEQTLAEASSPCAGCKVLASEVFKEAAAGSPDKLWVEAMVRVHGKEWCARQSESVLPPYDPWATFKGITAWSQIGEHARGPQLHGRRRSPVRRRVVHALDERGRRNRVAAFPRTRARVVRRERGERERPSPSRRTRRGTGTAPRRIRFPIHR